MNTVTIVRTKGSVDVYLDDEGGLEHVCIGSGSTAVAAIDDAVLDLEQHLQSLRDQKAQWSENYAEETKAVADAG